MTDKVAQSSYDEVPYPVLSYAQSHPDRLATLATMLGMDPAPVTRCRVLELGCASGGNLIPMAYGLPESEFVGLDASTYQITEGEAAVAALGLRNITLRQGDILETPAELGQFDYIIAHGIYSWVPSPVREKILAICRQHLAPNGVAYVSYNTYPGWHMLGLMRDMMLYRTRRETEPLKRVSQGRAFLDFLAEAIPAENSGYGSFIQGYVEFLKGGEGKPARADAGLLHDELEQINQPFYFHQFAERAAAHGLQYLGEAEFRTMLPGNFPPEVTKKLGQLAQDLIEMEQYMDFLRNRSFRQTLLCHQEVTLQRKMNPQRLPLFSMASRALPESAQPDIYSVSIEKFSAVDGAVLTTDHPVTKAAMLYLAEVWPQAVPFTTLLTTARARLGAHATEELHVDAQLLGLNLLTSYGYSGNLMEFHLHAPDVVLEVSERPVASPVARLQAQSGSLTTNLRHERVYLDELDRYLLLQLDGSHTQTDLLEALLAGPVAAGDLKLKVDQPEHTRQVLLAEELEKKLHVLARAALLIG